MSRKVTKFVSLRFADEEKKIEDNALQFVLEVQSLIPNDFRPHRVINIDQMGINLEVVSGRTLEVQGEKAVIKCVQTPNAMQHSSTVMPAITAAGELLSPLYICMKEANQEASQGRFGPQVEQTMFRHPNIHVVANTSAIMNKPRTMEYFRDVLFPNAPNNFLLICDSTKLFKDDEMIESVKPVNTTFLKKVIPPKATGLIQPLDLFFNRQFKHFVRKFQDRIRVESIGLRLSKRNNILKLYSLTVHQFQAECFVDMIKYSFFKAGYILERPPRFETPATVCFPRTFQNCQKDIEGEQCNALFFIRCARCQMYLCLEHFFALNTNDSSHMHYC